MENLDITEEPADVISSDTNNATTIDPKEAPPGKQYKFRRFREYNRGMYNGPKRENTELLHRQDDLHRFDSIASSLELSKHQKKSGRQAFESIDLHCFGTTVDHAIFGVCVIVANRDVNGKSRYYPNPKAAGDKQFESIAETLGLDRSDQLSAIEKVRTRTNL